jgi:type VI protein secretion system component VasF
MSPKYQNVIDPLISSLLEIIERSPRMTISELTVELRGELDRANAEMETDKQWKYAAYAIVAWIDSEMILNHNRWKDETLESHYFKMGNAYSEFFVRAELAYTKRYFDAFEVFYICFMFGYHGIYQTGDKTVVPKNLPLTDAEWQKQAAGRISRIRKQKPKETWGDTYPDDWQNLPLDGYRSFTNSLFLFVTVLATSLAILIFLYRSN